MKAPFFSRRVRLFGNVAVLVLCAVFFLTPFEFRGARMSLRQMKNDVKDWLPKDFPETTDLDWFREHFLGEQFILVTWPGCTEDDEQFKLFVEKVRADLAPVDQPLLADTVQLTNSPLRRSAELAEEEEFLQAREIGDQHELHYAGQYYQDWGGRDEKWLKGKEGRWYFVTPDGELYRWEGRSNLLGFLMRSALRAMGKRSAEGEFIAAFGPKSRPEAPNPFHQQPNKLTARFFKTVTTGPEVRDQLTAKGGPLWPRNSDDDDVKAAEAIRLANHRLTGTLFGPPLPDGFGWTVDEFERVAGAKTLERLPQDWRATFNTYVDRLVADEYAGNRETLQRASPLAAARHWDDFFAELKVPPPPRRTCAVITLSDVGRRDLSRVVGRPLMGKPRGRILEIAIAECKVDENDLRLGGPPVDNVAIDEEGSITLVRLVSFCAIVGLGLAYVCFRSLKVTIMVFFVGGVSAATSLGIVWWCGSSVDAILLSMPSLIYVLGLSGAVHIVNYYRDAVEHEGLEGAPETAIKHGWFPCTLAAFTTSLGLISLCTSNLVPIRKFGFFSAIGTMATLVLLFTYLPAALQTWVPHYRKRTAEAGRRAATGLNYWIASFWEAVGVWVIRRHGWVTAAFVALLAVVGWGLVHVETSVKLLKLFDGDAKIIRDYRWLETNFGKLVPMELVVRVHPEMMRPTTQQRDADPGLDQIALSERLAAITADDHQSASRLRVERAYRALHEEPPSDDEIRFGQKYLGEQPTPDRCQKYIAYLVDLQDELQLNFLERIDLVDHVQQVVADQFGDAGRRIVGQGMSAATVAPPLPAADGSWRSPRSAFNVKLEESRAELLESDYVRIDKDDQSELWRISLRLGALNDVDYGDFVGELNTAVEPILKAYEFRRQVVLQLARRQLLEPIEGIPSVLVIGAPYGLSKKTRRDQKAGDLSPSQIQRIEALAAQQASRSGGDGIDQTQIFADALKPLLINAGYRLDWHDPRAEPHRDDWKTVLSQQHCVIVVENDQTYDLDMLREDGRVVIDARNHHFTLHRDSDENRGDTAFGRNQPISVVYTGIVPVVYKSQHTLLTSLGNSIALAFVMIALVMMVLLRNWRVPVRPWNLINPSGGMISMLPNIFPVVIIFGAMGHLGMKIDIGTMMTASVAMGVAVDDTIHFLSWFRIGLGQGLPRKEAILLAYKRVATAMTQTTAIGGLGLAVFALSTFTPTQRFGVLMLILLVVALIGDLVFLPALLAGPLGRFFGKPRRIEDPEPGESAAEQLLSQQPQRAETPHSGSRSQQSGKKIVWRNDPEHRRTRK